MRHTQFDFFILNRRPHSSSDADPDPLLRNAPRAPLSQVSQSPIQLTPWTSKFSMAILNNQGVLPTRFQKKFFSAPVTRAIQFSVKTKNLNHRGHRGSQRKKILLCDPLCPLWLSLNLIDKNLHVKARTE
jgi:hypothetical protein